MKTKDVGMKETETDMKKQYIIATLEGSQLVTKTFATEKEAHNKLLNLTERGFIAGIPVKIIEKPRGNYED